MLNVKIREWDENFFNDLLKSTDSFCISIGSDGIKKDRIYFLEDLLSERNDFKVDISTEKNDSPDYISGIDIISQIPNARRIRVQATLKFPLEDLNMFANIIDLIEIDIYGNILKGILLDPLKKFNNLESVKIENGLTLRQQTFLEEVTSLRLLDVGEFNALSFSKNKYIKALRVNKTLTGVDSLPRALPELETLYLDQCRCLGNLAYLKDMPKLKKMVIKNVDDFETFPDLSKIKTLRKLEIYNMSKLFDISTFSMLDKLESILLYNIEKIDIENLLVLKKMEQLKHVGIFFKNGFKDQESKIFIKSNKSWTEIKIS